MAKIKNLLDHTLYGRSYTLNLCTAKDQQAHILFPTFDVCQ